jgi:2-polyprenyl-3-methyl-5-hydroxy-6-metoxy-1,4-benzoquinol methylase
MNIGKNLLGFYKCPVCGSNLYPIGDVYTLDQLLDLWKPVVFSEDIIKEHRVQSDYTQKYHCSHCELDIFLPIITGTPNFYKELQLDKNFGYYQDIKWEFFESEKDVYGSGSLIEIGCGIGNYLEYIRNICLNIWGVEYNETAIQCAREKGLNIIHVDEEMDLKRESFDVATSFHVLEHVNDPYGFVQNMMRWIKPGGKMCISVPNQDGPVKYITPCQSNMPPHHITRWRERTFKVLASKLNLKIDRITYEPLLLSNHSYYSYYWVNSFISGDSILSKSMRFILNHLLTTFFESLIKLHFKYFGLLRGQSIYVVFRKAI